ncbi:MAG TPA: hypothetical protein VFP79_12515 [Pseudolabrys sp.]|nr:hypothetical protein [Pseudolabrys sp.]
MTGVTHVGHLRKLAQPGRGRVAELRRVSHSSNEPMIPWDYHLPFGKTEARTEALKWIWQI